MITIPTNLNVGACHREQFVNKCSCGLTGTASRCIIRKIVYMGKEGGFQWHFPEMGGVACYRSHWPCGHYEEESLRMTERLYA